MASPYDAPGAAGGPDLFIKIDQFHEAFCAIPPDCERLMAQRMNAVTESVDGSHAAFMAQHDVASGLILKALASL